MARPGDAVQFFVDGVPAGSATVGERGEVQMLDVDPAEGGLPTLSIGDISLYEGNAGTTAFNFTVTLSAPIGADVTFNWGTAVGTATSGIDYVGVPATTVGTVQAGNTTAVLTVTVNGETFQEDNETFLVNLSNVSANATIFDGQAVGTILDDDRPPAISIADVQVLEGDAGWRALSVPEGDTFAWDDSSTYIRKPSFFDNLGPTPAPLVDIKGARPLAILGDSVTTDHISPAGNIAKNSPAARYLDAHGVKPADYNQYGARRGNHEVMVRGTFANIRLKNLMLGGVEGGFTKYFAADGSSEQLAIYDAAMKYEADGVPLVVLAGEEYGTGSSRDWAAKGTFLLGVRAVIAKSFERIHRSNLIGMGVVPLEFEKGQDAQSLGLTGDERFDIEGIAAGLAPKKKLTVRAGGKTFTVIARVDTPQEVEYVVHGGILQYVLRQRAAAH